MKRVLRWLAWGVGGLLWLFAFGNSAAWEQATLAIGTIVLYCYFQLSKQIAQNHQQVTRMLENTYRAAAGLPRDD